MKILFLTQWFQPEPCFKGLPFAKGLVDLGHEVEVLTGFPNYPGGKIYPGYRLRLFQREVMDGIRINRVLLYPSHDASGLKRMINYVSFGLSALLLGPWLICKPDVIYVYNLVTLGWAAYYLRALYGCKVIYDIQDLWPESVTNSGMLGNRFALWFLERWCRGVYGRADVITVLSPGFKTNMIQRGIPAEKIEVIYNWCDETGVVPGIRDAELAAKYGLKDTFNVMFAGTMGVMQGLDVVLDAARLCSERVPQARFILVGGGIDRERLRARAQAEGLSNVIFLAPQAPSSMGRIYGLADALLVHLKDEPLFRITIPSKTQAYMAAGLPIIMAMRGDAADLIQQSGGGVVCNPEDPEAIVAAVENLLHLSEEERCIMGQRAREYYRENMSFDKGVKAFLQLIASECEKN